MRHERHSRSILAGIEPASGGAGFAACAPVWPLESCSSLWQALRIERSDDGRAMRRRRIAQAPVLFSSKGVAVHA
ncbi:hypothetical protein [Nocardia sp. NPDC052566]|uniref:hypothetical protein n=1 Tax=Nocardia sp. NPDC052566 TaxID=3364330 RepID=UPI0037C6E2BB